MVRRFVGHGHGPLVLGSSTCPIENCQLLVSAGEIHSYNSRLQLNIPSLIGDIPINALPF